MATSSSPRVGSSSFSRHMLAYPLPCSSYSFGFGVFCCPELTQQHTGGVISDVTVLEGVLEDKAKTHVFAYVPTKQPGISFKGDWHVIGQRLTVC